ncbi:MAG: peptidase M28, partial [Candidatus Eremiobacteraeota bacterium]|nr:peptidase M28 [Candidatus Eremiobacteraeota bacterium]
MKTWIFWSVLALAASAQPVIEGERIRAHLKHLAGDEFEGRGTGQPGGDRAADYIAEQFRSYGLETSFQEVPLVGVSTLPTSTFTL